ncbi:uncharacterized protein LOC132307097 [Cornus florida]|uniref:uncharacterized protein LOC132307097 n=1 Tax=Cornus florida TaxID=4283 RepID=UPI0028A26414|nr:uncharacterized protein LOC132307097 [Cornus florida]
MQCERRNPFASAGAIMDHCLYVAGGYEGNLTHAEPSAYLNSAKRLNLKTREWQALPSMQKARAFATGLAHRGKFYVFGGATPKDSAEIYNPLSNTWLPLNSFLREEAEGFAVTTMLGNLVILTWSDRLGIKLWLRVGENNEDLEIGNWKMVCFFPNTEVERSQFRRHGATMVRLGKEVLVLVGGLGTCVWRVDAPVEWPIFPAPNFRPGVEHEVVHGGHIHAFTIQDDGTLGWR